MMDGILKGDNGRTTMFYVKDPPWHKLGKRLNSPPTAAEAIAAAGLNWDVVKAPLFYRTPSTDVDAAPSRYGLIPDKGWVKKERPVFGVVKDRYRVLQNRDAFAFMDLLVKKGAANFETAGLLEKNGRVWVMVKLEPNLIEIGPDDSVQPYLLLSTAHDGRTAVKVKFTPVRTVCQTTLSMAMQDVHDYLAVPHDEFLNPHLDAVADLMEYRIKRQCDLIREKFIQMFKHAVDQKKIDLYLESLFPAPPPSNDEHARKSSDRRLKEALRNRMACLEVYNNSSHCRRAGATLWHAYNAVIEFIDRWTPAQSFRPRTPETHLDNIWFGPGYLTKVRAFAEAMKILGN